MVVNMVAEHGWKVRGVTKSPARALADGSAYRRALFPLILREKHVVTSESLLDPELLEITFRRPKWWSLHVFSADFSDATTSMSHEVLKTFGEAFGVPLRLLYEGHTVMGKPVTTGCPMGLPVSWTALSIVHNAICELVDRNGCYRIKGDDLIALWSSHQISEYTRIAGAVGLVINEKTWVHRSMGTFCEGDYRLTWHGRDTAVLRRLPTFSLRSFVKNEPLPIDVVERFISRGVPRGVLHSMQLWFHSKWIKVAAEKSVPLYAPLGFGGLGFVSEPDRQLDALTCRMVNASHNGTLVYDGEAVKHRGLAGRVQSIYVRTKWSVTGQFSASEIKAGYEQALARCSMIDALGADHSGTRPPSLGKRVRALGAMRRRFDAARIPTVLVPTSVRTAYDVLARLRPCETPLQAEDEMFGFSMALAMEDNMFS
jgi:hypothetical protein